MKRLLLVLSVLFALAGAGTAQTKISALPSATPVATDVVPFVADPAGAAATKKTTVAALLGVQHDHSGGDITSGTVGAARLPATTVNACVNDINVSCSISAQALTLSWAGALSKARQHAATIYSDQANTFGTFLQSFQAGSNFELRDPTDISKKLRFDLSGVATGTARIWALPDASSTFVGTDTTQTLTNKTLTTPTIASFASAAHNHTNAAGGGQLTDGALSAAVSVSKGGSGNTSLGDDAVFVGDSSSAATARTLPNCTDTGGNHLNYATATNTFTCGTSSSGGGSSVPVYDSAGSSVSSPHIVIGSSVGNTTVTLSGSAIFSSASSYVCNVTEANTAATTPHAINRLSGSQFVINGGSSTVFVCIGN